MARTPGPWPALPAAPNLQPTQRQEHSKADGAGRQDGASRGVHRARGGGSWALKNEEPEMDPKFTARKI